MATEASLVNIAAQAGRGWAFWLRSPLKIKGFNDGDDSSS